MVLFYILQLPRIVHEVYGDLNNGYERLLVCQSEAAKFSKALEEQFGYLVDSLQRNICESEGTTHQKFSAIFNRLDQLLMSIDIEETTTLPKKLSRTIQGRCLEQNIIVKSKDLDAFSVERISHCLRCHPYATMWVLIEEDDLQIKHVWDFFAVTHYAEHKNLEFLTQIASNTWHENPMIYRYSWSSSQEYGKISSLFFARKKGSVFRLYIMAKGQ